MTLTAKENFFKLGGKSQAPGFATMHAANAFKFTRAPGNSANYSNNYFFQRYQSNQSPDFLGPLSNLLDFADGKVDMSAFRAARDAVSAVTRELQAELAPIAARRVRRMSEHDGEWDYARRFEVAPFQNSRREINGMARVVDVEVCFQFCAGREKKDINKFGALAFAVIDAIEKTGVSTNLTNSYYTEGLVSGGGRKTASKVTMEVKRSGEYLDESLLARCYTVEAYRRCIFSLAVASCDAHEKTVESGLGRPTKETSSAGHGFIKLAPDFVDEITGTLDTAKLKRFLRQALGVQVGDTRKILTPPQQAPKQEPIYNKEVIQKQITREEPKPTPAPDEFKDFPKGTMCRITYGPEAGKTGRVFWTGLAKKSGTPRIGIRFDSEKRNVFMSLKQVCKI